MRLLDGLKWFLNPVWVMDVFFTLWGGGGSQTSTGTTYTSNVPAYMEPFFKQVVTSGGKNIFETTPIVRDPKTGKVISGGDVTGVKAMPTYMGDRVAAFSDAQLDVQNQIRALQESGQWDQAEALMNQVSTTGSNLATQGFDQAFAYKPEDFQSEKFTGAVADEYGSPYQQRVTDIALRENARQAALARKNAMLQAQGRGTGGGGRAALMQANLLRDQMASASDIQAKGSQAAYENAQKMFEADQARRIAAYNARRGAKEFAAGLGKDVGLAGLRTQAESAKAMGDMAKDRQLARLEMLKAKATSAKEKQDLDQKILDIKYQTAMEERDWEKKQLEWLNSLIHGTQGIASTQVQYGAPNSPLQGIGLGLSGLSLMKGIS